MKIQHKYAPLLALATLAIVSFPFAAPARAADASALDASAILDVMHRVADWQFAQTKRMEARDVDWTAAAYYAGLMALAEISPRSQKYLDNIVAVATARNQVVPEGKKPKAPWRLAARKYHADDQSIAQTYLELAERLHNPDFEKTTRDYYNWLLANPPKNPDDLRFADDSGKLVPGATNKWSWCDALFMAPPALARLYAATGDLRFLNYMNDRWWRTTAYLYDKDEHLYTRDSRYFSRKEPNGKKIFWGCGNGWVLAGIVRVLQYMPENYSDRPRYIKLFRDMTEKILSLQQPDGLWRASMLDPAAYPSPETSGTGFFTYALAWGVNTGILDRATCWPAVLKAWAGLNAHVNTEGRLGSCQPIGETPKHIRETDTELYGSGAFLLAGSEMYKAALLARQPHGVFTVQNTSTQHRRWFTVEVPAATLRELAGTDDPSGVIVIDNLSARIRDSRARDGALIFQTTIAAGDTQRFLIVRKSPSTAIQQQ